MSRCKTRKAHHLQIKKRTLMDAPAFRSALLERGQSGRQQSTFQRVGVDHDELTVLLPCIFHGILCPARCALPAYGNRASAASTMYRFRA